LCRLVVRLCRVRAGVGTIVAVTISNKIKVIKRMRYGYRDEGYFFLKIHAAFPGIPENAR